MNHPLSVDESGYCSLCLLEKRECECTVPGVTLDLVAKQGGEEAIALDGPTTATLLPSIDQG